MYPMYTPNFYIYSYTFTMLKSRLNAQIWGGLMPIGYFSSFHILANVITRRRKVSCLLLVKSSLQEQWEMALPYSVVQNSPVDYQYKCCGISINLPVNKHARIGIDILSLSQHIRVQDPFISSRRSRSREYPSFGSAAINKSIFEKVDDSNL